MEVRVLGPVEVCDGSDVRTPPSVAQRRLLAILALHRGRAVAVDTLVQLLDVSPGAVRTSVARLRRLLPQLALRTVPAGYVLQATVDAETFESLLDGAPTPDQRRRLQRTEEALALVAGPPLEEFAHEAWAAPYAARLDERIAHAEEERAEALILLGRWSAAVAAMEQLTARRPLRDCARGLLMRAYAGAGRQAEALAAYAAYRHHLIDELGTEPSAEVRDIQHRIATAFVADGAGYPASHRAPDAPTSEQRRGHPDLLPRYRSSLHGREAELARVREAIRTHPIVTVVGPGGVGKTRLVSHVAGALHRDGGRVWYAPLATVSEGAAVARAVATAVAAPSVDAITTKLGLRTGLLVLDNCEHVLDAAADLVGTVADACPGISVLATSRAGLGVDGEQIVALPPLPRGAVSEGLFVARALAAGAPPDIAAADGVRAICDRLDGLPLAIEIAAGCVGLLGLDGLASLPQGHIGSLDAGRRRVEERHRTLQEAIAWSYDLLTSEQQRAFRMLAAFPDSFELDAAAHLLERTQTVPAAQAPSVVAQLVDRSVITTEAAVGGASFRLLRPLRDDAHARMIDAGEAALARTAQASWIASLTDDVSWDLHSPRTHAATVRLEQDIAGWRSALGFARETSDARLAGCLLGPPTGLLVLGRPDLADAVLELVDLLPDQHLSRLSGAFAMWSRGLAAKDRDAVGAALQQFVELDPEDRTGATRQLDSAFEILVTGDVESATRLRRSCADDASVPQGMRDHILANALYGVHLAGRPELQGDDWVGRVAAIAARTEVASTRQLAHLALARALQEEQPQESRWHLRQAEAVEGANPLLLRRIWTASMWRHVLEFAPSRAAAGLRAMLEEQIDRGYPDDQTTMATVAALFVRAAHPAADDVVATVARTASIVNLRRSFADADARVARGTVLDDDDLLPLLLRGLREIEVGTKGIAPQR